MYISKKLQYEKSLIGLSFGRLTIIEFSGSRMYGTSKSRFVICKCECGTIREFLLSSIRYGYTQSCGCLLKERQTKHGISGHRLYKIFYGIKARCYYKLDDSYKDYGGRGITICDDWLNDVKAFYDWAIKNGWKRGLDIDRIKNDQGYSPSNCRITTRKINANNTRKNVTIEYNGETKTLSEWADALRVNVDTLRSRLYNHENFGK